MMGARSHENSTIEYLTCNRIVEKYGVTLCTNNKFHVQFIKSMKVNVIWFCICNNGTFHVKEN